MKNFLSSVSNDVLSFTNNQKINNSYLSFINLCFDKFGNKFKYIENTFIDENTEMTISFRNVEFQMKPKQHLKSETGFPNVINYDLFYVMVQDALGDEFKDYKFIKDSYKTYGIPMTILYKNVEYRRIPSRIVKYFSRNNTEYEEFKEIAAHYTNYEDMSADYPLIFPKIKERLWIELIQHFDIYKHKDYTDIDFIKEKIIEYKKQNKSVEEFILNEPRIYINLCIKNMRYMLLNNLEHSSDVIKNFHHTIKYKENDRCIYAYEFDIDNKKYVYVGLTNNHIRRDQQHRISKNSAVYLFSINHNIDIPQMKIIIDYEDENLAKKDENRVLLQYINNGYIKINRIATGSLGNTIDTNVYTKEDCQKFIKENNIKYRTQWLNLNKSSYDWAKNNNLLDELLPVYNNFTYEECLADAKKYDSGKQWMRCSKTIYRYARNMKWLTDITHTIRQSTCIAMCSIFNENVIYRVFEKVGDVNKIFGFNEDGVLRMLKGERNNYMDFVWKRISYKEYENMKFINNIISKDMIMYISKQSHKLRITLKKTKPILVFENDKRDIPLAAYKTSKEASNSPYLKFKKIDGKFSNIIKRCSIEKPLEISNGYFWRYGTFEEYYKFYQDEINYLNSLGIIF